MAKRHILLFFLSSIFNLMLMAQSIHWQSKVEPQVLVEIEDHQVTDFIVWFGEQANLTEAYQLTTKLEKGEFVFRKLREVATQSQQNALMLLKNANAKHFPLVIVNAIAARGDAKLIAALATLPEVKMILADPAVQMRLPNNETNADRATEWGIQKIKADSAWMLGFSGAGVVIGGQDTGYQWDLPALKSKYRGWNGTYPVHSYSWFDAVDSLIQPNSTPNPLGYSNLSPIDDDDHGTHTMGTMVGSEGANEIGVAPNAKWIGCRNMDRGAGKPSSYTKCFNWFLAPRDSLGNNPMPSLAPDVINNSWRCPPSEGCTTAGTYALMEQAINNLKIAGIMVVASAGNEGSDCGTIADPPGIFENSFSIGATDINDNIAGFSSRGPATKNGIYRMKPNVTAPGVAVRSCLPNGTYGIKSGTSMSGPHVAGAVAILLSAKPSLKGQVELIETLLENTAIHLISTDTCGQTQGQSPNNTFGHGRIDILAALSQTLPVNLSSFYLKIEEDGNHLFWTTELESNTSHFDIEKSEDGKLFTKIGEVKAAGFSTTAQSYNFLDKDLHEGLRYYRLKNVDRDLTFDYSKILVASRINRNKVVISPNPTTGQIKIQMNMGKAQRLKVEIINVIGQSVAIWSFDSPKGYYDTTLNLDNLANACYFLKASNDAGELLFQKKIVLQQ
jgi:serine protease AprX